MIGPTVEVVEGDLLDQDVDVIVNAWNRNIIPWWLLLPQGVSGRSSGVAEKPHSRNLASTDGFHLAGQC